MELRINRLPDETHAAAKFLAARTGITLNKFILDAIHAHALRTAHAEGLTEAVLKKVDKKPARS